MRVVIIDILAFLIGVDNMAKWIWKFGDFEAYHNILVSTRRQTYGYGDPPVWKLYSPEPSVRFKKTVKSRGGQIKITAKGSFVLFVYNENGEEISVHRESIITLPTGNIEIVVRVANAIGLPCLYIEGDIETDEDWFADDYSEKWQKVGCWDKLCKADDDPMVFPFEYNRIFAVNSKKVSGGLLYDFGKETFARLKISNLKNPITIYLGESKEEALDKKWCVLQLQLNPKDSVAILPAYAFRYIFIEDKSAIIEAEYEYLPVNIKAEYKGDPLLEKIWDAAVYTLHLNCREFLLDGIKRDRWVWSGDAYQSYFVCRYLFADKEIEKRTITALGGKAPVRHYLNTIVDYTYYWLISLWEYYENYGDKEFLEQIFPIAKEQADFVLSRLDGDGLIRSKVGDWIFIDWADIDKSGALSAEQILLARALECFGKVCQVLELPCDSWFKKSSDIQQKVHNLFFDKKRGCFVDSYESGKNHISRHSNILAFLYLPCDDKIKKSIYENVILNDEIAPITTPYFKFYEFRVHAKMGNISLLESQIKDYYGGMLDVGATTLFEEFDPTKKGTEHYAMYGRPYEKSLCHAWSTSPIYLLGRFRAGVENVGIGYDKFIVKPYIEDKKHFEMTVPTPKGDVKICYDGKTLEVSTKAEGGTLILGDIRYELDTKHSVTVVI